MQKTVYELTCKWCGGQFIVGATARDRKRQYCGQECSRHGRWKPNPSARYRNTAQMPETHPLVAGKKTRTVGAHQIVLWERIGPGVHPCHHCATPVTWEADRWSKERLQVDHLDRNKLNNCPDNLVPCCHRCNMLNRDVAVSDDEPWRLHAGGWRIRGNPTVCRWCGKHYVARRDNKGMYCSISCRARGVGAARSSRSQPQ